MVRGIAQYFQCAIKQLARLRWNTIHLFLSREHGQRNAVNPLQQAVVHLLGNP
jgi:hypothetical protein